MKIKVEKSDRNYIDKDGRQIQCNEGICKVRLDNIYIGAVSQTNYYNDSASRWIVWEWKKYTSNKGGNLHYIFEQNYNSECNRKSDIGRRKNSFDLKRDAVKALVEREQERLTNKGFI